MYRYYLSAIYDDNKTNLGTYANRSFKGKSLNRVLSNFKKQWQGRTDWKGAERKIIGVEIEKCINGYQSISVERVIF